MDYDLNELYNSMTTDELFCIGKRLLDQKEKLLYRNNGIIKKYKKLLDDEYYIVSDLTHERTMELINRVSKLIKS